MFSTFSPLLYTLLNIFTFPYRLVLFKKIILAFHLFKAYLTDDFWMLQTHICVLADRF